MYCKNCGAEIDEKALICVNCGTKNGEGADYCSHCGTKVEKGQIACMGCGYALPKEKTSFKQIIKNKKKPIIVTCIVIGILVVGIIALFVVLNLFKGVDLKKIYSEHCISTWAQVGDDGSYLYIDTNPYNWEDDGLAYPEAYYAIEAINEELGLPTSLCQEIGQTTANDGKQIRIYEDLGIEISWRYHPDKGLEITYAQL